MTVEPVSGTEGYAEQSQSLIPLYDRVVFTDLHAQLLPLMPAPPARVLDIGSGTGRDAAALDAMGHDVVAVEPTAELRAAAIVLHDSPRIVWLDDSLPELKHLDFCAKAFDVVLLSAVWMHLDDEQRRRAMPRVAGFVKPGGLLYVSLRHGPVPSGRRMFEVTAAETIELAEAEGLQPVLRKEDQDSFFQRADVSWTRLAFRRPD